jgi:peptidoglycan-associated lipoprotein
MLLKLLSLFAALLLASACATDPEGQSSASGKGSSKTATTSSAGSSGTTTTTASPAVSTPTPGSAEEFITIGDRVYFDFDKSGIRADAVSTLNDQAAWLNKYPGVTVLIEGHCDERGTREYNLALGERRANSVREYLVSRGVSMNRIEIISYGKERPEVLGSNESAWQQNRRGVTLVKNASSS